jgi:acetyltransferase-like isoleucine patch superfamily enzyme
MIMKTDMIAQQTFQQLVPGMAIVNDWCNFPIPLNMEVGVNTVIDSSASFKKYFSKLPVGLKVGSHVTLQSPALATEENGYIEIGDYSHISSACLAATLKISIGNYVFIAGGVTIVDTDFTRSTRRPGLPIQSPSRRWATKPCAPCSTLLPLLLKMTCGLALTPLFSRG